MMDERLQEAADDIQKRLGFGDQYRLVRHELFPEKNILNETYYVFSTEWFPVDAADDEDFNPAGTAVVDIDLHSKALRRLVFVHETTLADQASYPEPNESDVIEWIEEMTGLVYGKQFTLAQQNEDEFAFAAAVDHIPVSPTGWIGVEFDDGKLTMFTMDGHFPNDSEVEWEPFALTFDKIAYVAEQQCRLIDIPIESEERWQPIYTIEEAFVKNDGRETISLSSQNVLGTMIEKDLILEWDERDETPFEQQELDLALKATADEAFNRKAHPDTLPITAEAETVCVEEAKRFLKRVFPEDSGQWRLVGLRRENGYIFADLKPADVGDAYFQRKIQVVLDGTDYEAVNAIDNKMLLDMFENYTPAENARISAKEAFEQLRDDIELSPTYVYDQTLGHYVLSGRLDCLYGIDATTGQHIELNEL
ncbi:hypothetical protein JNUCC1_01325 [Lentibacillus sp. JNUCC-1]|uniref:hypothetical protein n=1 Tax=Lentibacillus sp. JNUCC-1 TaxID=2654513 RepID=UPI0012E8D1DE|nr:hypothetical protein [Lentibacillus sp. JNUCC-1]MUV37519.1 hypothetical protein [Lentibacillus sp. JNUCC-1]